MARDTILSINVVEKPLVEAVQKHAKEMGRELKGLMLVDVTYADQPDRPRDTTGLFEEIVCDFNNLDALQQALKPYMDSLLAVTCRYESAIQPLRKVIPFLPYIPAPTETSLLWSTEKPMMRDRLAAYNPALVPRYKYIEAKDLSNVLDHIKDFSYPLIVKPSCLAEALLVTRCDTEAELLACLDNTFSIITDIYKREHRTAEPSVLIEEMMQGDMYSTDAYVTTDGQIFCLPLVKVITAHSIGLPGFYSYRHIIPVDLPTEEIEAAFEVSRQSIRALNLRATTTHIELFQTPDGWKIIEVGARIGGYREPLYREAFGVEHFYNDLAVRMGGVPTMPDAPLRHAAGVNIYADTEGTIQAITGFEEAQKLNSVVFLAVHAVPGDKALFASNGGQLIVDGILSNEDPEELERDVAKVRELIKIDVK
ncbi:ATP-grasp domain-containing protein [Candidatus Saccharibacteria bacterium]|nr:MAG: ATP-grasp domain-containing protein [Candidatus Saccharibacteria bacterium]